MAEFQPPPTYAEVVLIDDRTKKAVFNPIWLKWFIDLSANLGPGGAGTVTSIAETFTGGLISVGGSPITTSGTLALTVAGTSGGIPYFSGATTWASSGALATNALVLGGGAGNPPATTTTGTGVVTALGVSVGTDGAFIVKGGALGSPSSAGTLPAFTFGGTVSGGGNQVNNVIIGTSTPLAGHFTTLDATSTITPNQTAGIVGTTTNNNANAGSNGEYIESVSSGGTSAATSGQYTDLVTISLTAGDWSVVGLIQVGAAGAVVTQVEGGVSIGTAGNAFSDAVRGSNQFYVGGASLDQTTITVPAWRLSLSGTTTVRLKINVTYTVATPSNYGRLSARRVR